MSKAIVWAIRVGLAAFWRQGGFKGGPIMNFRTQADAEAQAARLRRDVQGVDFTVIQRSHGQFTPPATKEPTDL